MQSCPYAYESQGGWNWVGRGGTGPPSFLDSYSKNFKISQIWDENFFLFSRAPHKKFAPVHPVQSCPYACVL